MFYRYYITIVCVCLTLKIYFQSIEYKDRILNEARKLYELAQESGVSLKILQKYPPTA